MRPSTAEESMLRGLLARSGRATLSVEVDRQAARVLLVAAHLGLLLLGVVAFLRIPAATSLGAAGVALLLAQVGLLWAGRRLAPRWRYRLSVDEDRFQVGLYAHALFGVEERHDAAAAVRRLGPAGVVALVQRAVAEVEARERAAEAEARRRKAQERLSRGDELAEINERAAQLAAERAEREAREEAGRAERAARQAQREAQEAARRAAELAELELLTGVSQGGGLSVPPAQGGLSAPAEQGGLSVPTGSGGGRLARDEGRGPRKSGAKGRRRRRQRD